VARIRITPKAHEDLVGIYRYISVELENRDAAKNVTDAIKADIKKLSKFPNRGEPLSNIIPFPTSYRFIISGSYNVYYKVNGNDVEVSRILNQLQSVWINLLGLPNQ